MDGWADGPASPGNAISLAKTPNFDGFTKAYPNTELGASGLDVGLPAGQMGNSEVGHLNIGAGRVVYQDLTRITEAIADGSFFTNAVLLEAMRAAAKSGRRLHLLGLLSDGGVHSHEKHLSALIEMAKQNGVDDVRVHAFLDGRDVPPDSGLASIEKLEKKLGEIGLGRIATVSGRYYAMDRDQRWERTKLAWDAIVQGRGETAASGPESVRNSYDVSVYDEFVKPSVIVDDLFDEGQPIIRDDDAVIFFNFRPDRGRQLTRAFIFPDFDGFDRGAKPPATLFITMTEYDKTFTSQVAFPPEEIKNTLADVLAQHGLKQLHIAETEKYAHVTFFFNGGVEAPVAGEDRVLVPSPKVVTYDLKPEMSARKVTDKVIGEIGRDVYDVIILNYANADMVGHTAVRKAVVKAVETVDECLGRVVDVVLTQGGALLITADHGNADKVLESGTNLPFTAHTTNPVPLILISKDNHKLKGGGILADIAPTMLELLRLPKPGEMTGKSLIC
jgi:2,3-bisphosphoglycerate-independent phosphoglycerate mutase